MIRGVDTSFKRRKCGHNRQVWRVTVSLFWGVYSLLKPEKLGSQPGNFPGSWILSTSLMMILTLNVKKKNCLKLNLTSKPCFSIYYNKNYFKLRIQKCMDLFAYELEINLPAVLYNCMSANIFYQCHKGPCDNMSIL